MSNRQVGALVVGISVVLGALAGLAFAAVFPSTWKDCKDPEEST